jgi:hypothetical protein
MFYYIGLQTTTEISSYMICQSCWNIYHWQSEHEHIHDGAHAHFSRAVRDVINNIYHARWTGRGGPTAWPPCLNLYLWGHLQTLVYAARTDNVGAPHYRLVDACQTIRNCPGVFGRMRRSKWDVPRRSLNLCEWVLYYDRQSVGQSVLE